MVQKQIVGVGRVAEVFSWDEGPGGSARVLKLFRSGMPRSSVERELTNARAAYKADLVTPEPFDEVITHDDRLGIIYQRVDGPTLLQAILAQPMGIARYAGVLGELHFSLHQASVSGLPSQRERLLHSIDIAPVLTVDEKAQLKGMMDDLPDGDRLCHGDFHPDNIIYRSVEEGGPVIIDWPDASIGSPLADVARTRLLLQFGWRSDSGSKLVAKWGSKVIYHYYARRYFQLSGANAGDVDKWMTIVAAARLRENVEAEQIHLLRFVRKRLRQA